MNKTFVKQWLKDTAKLAESHLRAEQFKTIEVIISGGCVQRVINPTDYEIVIRNYDVEESYAEGNSNCKQDCNGDWFMNMIFPAHSS